MVDIFPNHISVLGPNAGRYAAGLSPIPEVYKTMAATLHATKIQDEEGFSLSELDYDQLLEVYGSDPVLMTIFNRMRDFFNIRPTKEDWFRITDWPTFTTTSGSSTTGFDLSRMTTSSTVSTPFSIGFDKSGETLHVRSTSDPSYFLCEE